MEIPFLDFYDLVENKPEKGGKRRKTKKRKKTRKKRKTKKSY